jgi:hypothetical protein
VALALSTLVPWWSVVGESFLVSPLSPGLNHPGHTAVGVILALVGLALAGAGSIGAIPRRHRSPASKPIAVLTTPVGLLGAAALVIALYGQVAGFKEVDVHPFPLGSLLAILGAVAVVVGAFRPVGRRAIPWPAGYTLLAGVLVFISAILPWWVVTDAQTFAPLASGILQIGFRDSSAHGTLVGMALLLLGLGLIVLGIRSVTVGRSAERAPWMLVGAAGVLVLLVSVVGATLGPQLVGVEVRFLIAGFGLIAALLGAALALAVAVVPARGTAGERSA